jgi:rhodanese-related sulfurtransferase
MTTLTATASAPARPGVATLSPVEAEKLVRAGKATLVDVREADEVRRERVPGALVWPSSCFLADTFPGADGRRTLVLCRSGARAGRVASALVAAGRTEVAVVEGGLLAWMAAGLPVVRDARAPLPIQRQVMLTVGPLILLCTLLAAVVDPWFLVGTGILGTGLTVAGATGFCGLATVLARMPWNRPAPASGIGQVAKTTTNCCGGS